MNKFQEMREGNVMRFTSNAYNDIINTIGNVHAEQGGLLFGYTNDYVVREFIFDEDAKVSGGSYTFNVEFLNAKIKELWEERGLACIGFIHSHPWGMKTPSYPDMTYFKNAFNWMPREQLLVPIVSTIPDGGFNLNPCMIFEKKKKKLVVADKIELIVEDHISKYDYVVCPYLRKWRKQQEENLAEVEELTDSEMEEIKNSIPPSERYYPKFSISQFVYELFKDFWRS